MQQRRSPYASTRRRNALERTVDASLIKYCFASLGQLTPASVKRRVHRWGKIDSTGDGKRPDREKRGKR